MTTHKESAKHKPVKKARFAKPSTPQRSPRRRTKYSRGKPKETFEEIREHMDQNPHAKGIAAKLYAQSLQTVYYVNNHKESITWARELTIVGKVMNKKSHSHETLDAMRSRMNDLQDDYKVICKVTQKKPFVLQPAGTNISLEGLLNQVAQTIIKYRFHFLEFDTRDYKQFMRLNQVYVLHFPCVWSLHFPCYIFYIVCPGYPR